MEQKTQEHYIVVRANGSMLATGLLSPVKVDSAGRADLKTNVSRSCNNVSWRQHREMQPMNDCSPPLHFVSEVPTIVGTIVRHAVWLVRSVDLALSLGGAHCLDFVQREAGLRLFFKSIPHAVTRWKLMRVAIPNCRVNLSE